ncbi:CbbY family protein [Vibrio ichthyoenteri ATCC 700023]|uniref:CbbY family protein n=1 Tax=Vibrio ichthyoenteri ATCC 700023 TaxID=870968 RepID=F9RZN8_9VIBR|nr:HAD-IA family hydrolase [Vibrio ichthyoenteri]EGU44697.1 CbbY family protein [Vibrio ichthyoenteri ATCC 700023]
MGQTLCVIFDCEGTLVDSEILCCRALSLVFGEFGASLPVEQAMSYFVGGKLADILNDTQRRLGLNVSLDILEPLYRQRLKQLFEQELKPMDGVIDTLATLDSKGISYCVASNGPRDKTIHALELTGLDQYFKGKVFSAFDTNSWKPEPDLILYSAMNMGFRVEECLYVDDTPKGLEAGVKAGMRTIQLEGINQRSYPGTYATIHRLDELNAYI